ncbi:MAG: nitrogen fixation protein FixH [Rhizorhabdus sp.]|nr:nitrogen fixation protein FixH [Rhizorhabdus sp.]
MTRHFTGRHMAAITITFFAVVIAVNLVMATFATRSFGGTVVDNSYVASQHFNRWLDEARAQRRQGWGVAVTREGDHAIVMLTAPADARIEATVMHPLGRLPEFALHFGAMGGGRYRSVEALPAGRWRLQIVVRSGAQLAHFLDEVPA